MIDLVFKYCPVCKSDLTDSPDEYKCGSCGVIIYKNSAPTASVLIVDKGKVLLAKRAQEPKKGDFDVVGGFLKYGEDPIAGLHREVMEETGLKVKILEMLGIYMDTYGEGGKPTLNIYYIGEIISGEMGAEDDVAELTWFDIDKLPTPAFKSQVPVFTDLQKWYRKNK